MGGFFWVKNYLYASTLTFAPTPTCKLQTSDIIFRKENNHLSELFSQMDNSFYSHIGVILEENNQTNVLHVELSNDNKDVKKESLTSFLRYATHYEIKRYNAPLDSSIFYKNGSFILQRQPVFDLAFDANTSDKLYCTELVEVLYRQSFGIDLSTHNSRYGHINYISIASIFNNAHLISLEKY
ncbi:MAG: YiiX/YebB-like N1pC/P60 family cysteine hydrolase [Sulfurospirillaceae bacterium]|nr:YiiX/YebB-like N1pC/P60 family cysteine hydrolase [Sulfurospirillaceae bacterium]